MAKPNYKNLKEKAHRLAEHLADGEYHKSRSIPMESRLIRELCSVYPSTFFSTQKGYKLVVDAADTELCEAIADLRSRIGHISERATALGNVLRKRDGQRELFT